MTVPTTDVDLDDGDKRATRSVDDATTLDNSLLIGTYLKRTKQRKSDGTYKVYRTQLRRFDAWLRSNEYHVTEVTADEVADFLYRMDDAGYAAETTLGEFKCVKDFYTVLEDVYNIDVTDYHEFHSPTELSQSDVDTAVSGPSLSEQDGGAERYFVTEEEKQQLVENVGEPVVRNRLVIELLWETGFRRSTLTNIELDDIDRDTRLLQAYSPKAGKTLSPVYSEVVADLLATYLDMGFRDGYYCADSSDKLLLGYRAPLEEGGVGDIVRDAAENAGIQAVMGHDVRGRPRYAVTPHTLRHGHAMHLLEETPMTIADVQKSLSHSDIETTEIYLQQSDERFNQKMREHGIAAREL